MSDAVSGRVRQRCETSIADAGAPPAKRRKTAAPPQALRPGARTAAHEERVRRLRKAASKAKELKAKLKRLRRAARLEAKELRHAAAAAEERAAAAEALVEAAEERVQAAAERFSTAAPPQAPVEPGPPSCIICLTEKPCVALRPCGHVCLCDGCYAQLEDRAGGGGGCDHHTRCPLCRQRVRKTLRVFVC